MNKKTKNIILVSFLLIVIIGITWFFVFLSTQQQTQIVERVRDISPFGQIQTIDDGSNQPENINNRGTSDGDGVDNPREPIPTEPDPEPIPLLPRLQQISNFPTGGFIPKVTITQEEVSDIAINEDGQTVETTQIVDVQNHAVRYASIFDGTVYETSITDTSIQQEVVVGNFIPNSQQIFFSKDADYVGFQYWNNDNQTIESYLSLIQKRALEVEPCPFTFTRGIQAGDTSDDILSLHQFLNRVPQTRIAESGINAPGNESPTATEATITAIKNFQTLHELEIDGVLGRGTKAQMETVCEEQQTEIAQKAFDANPEKYDIDGSFINQGIEMLAYAPESNRVFYIQPVNEGVEGVVLNLETGVRETIFKSPHSEWLYEWNYEDEIILTTKPSHQAIGYSYSLDPNTGNFYKIIEGRGLTVTGNYDGTYLFGTRIINDTVDSFIVNRTTGSTSLLLTQTFPEKCTWGRSNTALYCFVPNNLAYQNEYPDIWYQGVERFEDTLWKIDIESLDEELLSDIVIEYNVELDVQSVKIDTEGDYLYFVNKTEEDLWSYRLN